MKKKGFLNLKLIVIVLVVIIIGIVAFFYFRNSLNEQSLQTLSTEMLQIQAKIKIINERNKVNNTEEYIGEEATEEEIQKINIENSEKVKILTLDNLKELELTEIQEDKKFIVNYENEEVYYIPGENEQWLPLTIEVFTNNMSATTDKIEVKSSSMQNGKIKSIKIQFKGINHNDAIFFPYEICDKNGNSAGLMTLTFKDEETGPDGAGRRDSHWEISFSKSNE